MPELKIDDKTRESAPLTRKEIARKAAQTRWAKPTETQVYISAGSSPTTNIVHVITQNFGESNAPAEEIWTQSSHFFAIQPSKQETSSSHSA